MRRLPFRTLAFIGLIAFSIALYREWVQRNKPPLFLPLGFFEQALSVVTPEEESQNPLNWNDSIEPNVLDASSFDAMVSSVDAEETDVDVLVAGATLGGTYAALAAAEDGLSVALVTAEDWHMELLAEAGEFSAERLLSDAYGSTLERELRRSLHISTVSNEGQTNGLPSDIAAFFTNLLSKTPNVHILSPYSVVAFGRGEDGRITRALLQSPDGSTSVTTRFNYVIDGTNDGSVLARAGVASRSSWTETDAENEPETPSARVFEALTKGYSMSGRTLPGLGKRLEGAKMYIGVLDRGYNGWFVAPERTDPCWQALRDNDRAFIRNAGIMRAYSSGCFATMRFDADFEDSVDVFWINHGNDSVQATVRLNANDSISVYKQFDPSVKFVRLGTFPVTPEFPLSIDISSVLPIDKLEGLIVRKTNTGGRTVSLDARGNVEAAFETSGWNSTYHDVYVSTDNDAIIQSAMLDGAVTRAETSGIRTYVFRKIPLRPGSHSLKLPAETGTAKVIIVPTSPAREDVELSKPLSTPPKRAYAAWNFTAPRDGRIIFTAPPGACASQCYAYVTQSGSMTNEAETLLTNGAELIATSYPMFTLDAKQGAKYVVSVDQEYDALRKPMASFIDTSSELYASGAGNLRISPLRTGDAYDIWTRTRWSSKTNVSTPSGVRTVGANEGWQYVSTDILDLSGVTVDGTGFTELLAMPNTNMDVYRIPLAPDAPSTIEGMPYGTYNVMNFGIDDPERMRITDTSTGRVSIMEFNGDNGTYASASTFTHGTGPFTLSLTNDWPQTVVMYERLEDEEMAKTTFGSGALLLVLDGKAMEAAHPDAYVNHANTSAGAFLFTPRANGIGPVTIGTMNSPAESDRMRRYTNDAYLLLRFGRTNLTKPPSACSLENDPTCDPRRFIRDPLVFGTADAMAPIPVYPEGRRLDGRETLGYADAHAVLRSCTNCSVECVNETIDEKMCVRIDTSAWNTSAIVSFPGTEKAPTVTSPLEDHLNTLPALFQSMRRDGIAGPEMTYLEEKTLPRDVTVTLGMLIAANEPNILSANATASATHGGAVALRSPTAELLIGSAAGHVVGFAMTTEKSPLPLVADSPGATKRLQRYLIDKGVSVMPTGNIDNDPLLTKAIQWRVLEGRAWLDPSWIGGRLTYQVRLPDGEDVSTLKRLAFGETSVETVKDALRWFDGSDVKPDNVELLRLGLKNGFVNDKMLMLSLDEIMGQALNEDLLLKAEYLLHAH